MRRYELSPEQWQRFANTPLGRFNLSKPDDPVTAVWRSLGDEMGFDYTTIKFAPNTEGLAFHAEPVQSEPEPTPTSIAPVSNQETLDDIDGMSSAEIGALSSNRRQVQMSCGCAFERRYFTTTAFNDVLTEMCAFHTGFDRGFSLAKNTQPTKGQ